MKKRIAIFVSGRGSNMQSILEACKNGVLADCADPVVVFSNNPKSMGLEVAASYGVPTKSISSKGLTRKTHEQKVIAFLDELRVDYIVLAGYMRILSPLLVQTYAQRIINIHPADTTMHQGVGGYQWAFEQQLEETKITVHFVDEGVDTGNIILQRAVDLKGVASLEEVQQRGLKVEHQLYSDALRKVFTNVI